MDDNEIINILLNLNKINENKLNQLQQNDLDNYRKCEYCKVFIRKNNWSRHKLSKGHLENIEKGIDTNSNNLFKKFNKRTIINKTDNYMLNNTQNTKNQSDNKNNINIYKKIYKDSIRPIININK